MRHHDDPVDRLLRAAGSVRDPAIRVGVAREVLASLSPADLADLMTSLLVTVEARQPEHGDVLLVVSVALADPTMLAPRAEAALVAATRGQIEVARLLAQDRSGDDQEPGRVPDFGGARPLTLGERKTLARTSDRRLILKALRDPHPDVIRILLKNPRLIEDDVVRLAATRPIDPSILLAVFTDLRWVLRYRVRRTLVYNPHTPLDVALQLALNLNDQDLRAVSDSKSLRAELRDLTKRMLADVEVN